MTQREAIFKPALGQGEERAACIAVEPAGFHLRAPPAAHERASFITPDSKLFETIHMGPANVNARQWRLQVDGQVRNPFSLDLEGLHALPRATVTAVHECWGSPLRQHTENLLRVGNVEWAGVRLKTLLDHAEPADGAHYVWSEGLDSGAFGGVRMDRYQKDLSIAKAMSDEVLVAYSMNGEPLRKERGGPVRLVVPGWFGTNMTKWLCRLTLQPERAPSPFTTIWYNEEAPANGPYVRKPVWEIAPNSMIVEPADGSVCEGTILVNGWAWAAAPIAIVDISIDGGKSWVETSLRKRREFEWQAFSCAVRTHGSDSSAIEILARATDAHGHVQPLACARNACHRVTVQSKR